MANESPPALVTPRDFFVPVPPMLQIGSAVQQAVPPAYAAVLFNLICATQHRQAEQEARIAEMRLEIELLRARLASTQQEQPPAGTKRPSVCVPKVRRAMDGDFLSSEQAEPLLRGYVTALIAKLERMADSPHRLALSQRPDDTFLHRIRPFDLHETPTYLEFQGHAFPLEMMESGVLFYNEDNTQAVLNLDMLRHRVLTRIEKGGQRERAKMKKTSVQSSSSGSHHGSEDVDETEGVDEEE